MAPESTRALRPRHDGWRGRAGARGSGGGTDDLLDGPVRYEDNPRHRRARLVVATRAGTEALGRIEREQRPWADAIGAAVGQRDLDRLRTLLDRLTAAVEEQAASRVRGEDRA